MAEFLENVSKMKKREEKVDILKRATSFALRTILQGAYDPKIKWLLPPGIPPYKPNDIQDQEGVLLRECRKLNYFVEGGAAVRSQSQREMMFIELLENVAPADAKLLCSIKEKKLPYKGITADIVKEAFPDLISVEITN
jgi:hypothetical protein